LESKNIFVISSEQTIAVTSAISQTVACGNFNVSLKCDDDAGCKKASEEIRNTLDSKVAKGALKAEELEAVANRIRTTVDLDDAKNADMVIESVFEDRDVKREILSNLDNICPAHTILATNTSTITVTNLASITNRPDRVIGMHFIYFSPVMKVVEIARGLQTSDDTFAAVASLAKDVDLEIAISEDSPGLLSTRIWMVHLNEAINNVFNKLVEPGALAKLNRTISPKAMSILESADFIGLDNCIALLQNLYDAYGDPKYSPSPLLTQMIDAGQLGIKSGKGFFNYT